MGLADWFSTFCANIRIRDDEGTISTRYRAITQRLNTDYWTTSSETAHSLYVGSYGRNTAIQGISDLDMIFQLLRTSPPPHTARPSSHELPVDPLLRSPLGLPVLRMIHSVCMPS